MIGENGPNDMRWVANMFMALCAMAAIGICALHWRAREEFRIAAEAGLEQRAIPDGKGVYWVKPQPGAQLEYRRMIVEILTEDEGDGTD